MEHLVIGGICIAVYLAGAVGVIAIYGDPNQPISYGAPPTGIVALFWPLGIAAWLIMQLLKMPVRLGMLLHRRRLARAEAKNLPKAQVVPERGARDSSGRWLF